jgi:hypothetical protein
VASVVVAAFIVNRRRKHTKEKTKELLFSESNPDTLSLFNEQYSAPLDNVFDIEQHMAFKETLETIKEDAVTLEVYRERLEEMAHSAQSPQIFDMIMAEQHAVCDNLESGYARVNPMLHEHMARLRMVRRASLLDKTTTVDELRNKFNV